MLRLEHGDEVFVAELILRAIRGDVVGVLRRSLAVHISGIPLAAKRWDGIDASMDEDAELGVAVPRRSLVRLQRIPISTVGATIDGLIDEVEKVSALVVVLGAGLLPDAVNDFGGLRGCWGSRGDGPLGEQRRAGTRKGGQCESACCQSAVDSCERQAGHGNLTSISPEAETRWRPYL